MKALILLADGFEQTEALTTMDIFCRSKQIEPVLASISPTTEVLSSMGLKVRTDYLLSSIDSRLFDFLVLPGGKKGVENLRSNGTVLRTIAEFKKSGKPVYAICAAPCILEELGYLDDAPFTAYPGFEQGKGVLKEEGVVVDGDNITARGMAFTMDFALAIVAKHLGKDVADSILFSARGNI